jgi:adenylate cyclase
LRSAAQYHSAVSATEGNNGEPAHAYVIIRPDTAAEQVMPVRNRLFLGREPSTLDQSHQVVIDDPEVSRHHLEIRLDLQLGTSTVVDTSTNGTKLNGVRLQRAVPVPLVDGDRLRLGSTELLFRSALRPPDTTDTDPRGTVLRVTPTAMALVVGDVAGYTTIAQSTPGVVLVHALDTLFGELRSVLRRRRGTLADMPGDAFFAIWDLEASDLKAGANAAGDALDFALDAAAAVEQLAPRLSLRAPDGSVIAMGWAVVVGEVAISPLGASVLGDATNLAFRLSGLAGREGRPTVLVTEPARHAVGEPTGYRFGLPLELSVKGRLGTETVYGVAR